MLRTAGCRRAGAAAAADDDQRRRVRETNKDRKKQRPRVRSSKRRKKKTKENSSEEHREMEYYYASASHHFFSRDFSHLKLNAKDKNENLYAESIRWRIVHRKRREYLRFLSRARQRRKGTKKNSDTHSLRKIWMEGALIIIIINIITGDEDTKTRLNSRSFSCWE